MIKKSNQKPNLLSENFIYQGYNELDAIARARAIINKNKK
jgi:hypothetical protein